MFLQNTSSKYKFVLLTNQIRRPNSGTKHQTIVKFFEKKFQFNNSPSFNLGWCQIVKEEKDDDEDAEYGFCGRPSKNNKKSIIEIRPTSKLYRVH